MAASMVEKLLSDAKELANRLKERDTLADKIISTTRGVQQKLHAIQQYQENVERLNKAASHRPKMMLIQKLNTMNSQIEELNKDNSDLRQSLEDHQEILELIMNKFREQTHKLDSTSQLEATPASNHSAEDMEAKESKIREMVSVMVVASENWEEKQEVTNERRRLIALLQQNNRMMRMVLLNTTDDMLNRESSLLGDNLIDDFKTSLDINNKAKYDTKNKNNTNNNSNKSSQNISGTTLASSFAALTTDSDDTNNNTNIHDIIHNTLSSADITSTTPTNEDDNKNENRNNINKPSYNLTSATSSNTTLNDTLTCATSPNKTLNDPFTSATSPSKTLNDTLTSATSPNKTLNDTLTNATSPNKTLNNNKSHQDSKQADKMAAIKPQVYIYSDGDFHDESNSETETICDETLTRAPDFNVSLVTLS